MLQILKKIVLSLFFFFVGYVYFHNLSRSVYGGDAGDLITAAVVFGVPHAPGYPLFVFLGHLLSLLPFSATPAYKVGMLSVLSSIGSVIVYYLFAKKCTKNFFLSLLATAIFAFSYLFWIYTEIGEVFALNNFLCISLLVTAIVYATTKKSLYYYLTLFFCGLGLTNHQTIVLLYPSVCILLFGELITQRVLRLKKEKQVKKIKSNVQYMVFSVGAFVLGLLPYVYIPIAAHTNPPINWDNVHDIPSFFHLILRTDYGTLNAGNFTPSSYASKLISLKDYFVVTISSITFPAFLLCVLGCLVLMQKNVRIAFAIFLAWVLTGPIFIFYAGFPLYNYFTIGVVERFYIVSSILFLFFLPFGLLQTQKLFEKFFTQKLFAAIVMGAFILIPVLLFTYNSKKTDLSRVTIGDVVAKDIIQPLPKNSVLFLNGDTITFNTWYVQYVLHIRPDVHLVHILGAGNKTFMNNEEAIYLSMHQEKNAKAHMFPALYTQLLTKYPVFTLSQFTTNLSDAIWVPYGLSYKLLIKKDLLPEDVYQQQIEKIWKTLHVPIRDTTNLSRGNLTISEIPSAYSDALITTGKFFQEQYADGVQAKQWFTRAIAINPQNARPYSSLGLLYYSTYHSCSDAIQNFEKALQLDPLNSEYYVIMYVVYDACKEPTHISPLKSAYTKIFHASLDTDVKKKSQEFKQGDSVKPTSQRGER